MTRPQQQAMFARLNTGRTQGAIDRDGSVRAAETLPLTDENIKTWRQNQRRIDIEGVDTPVDRRLPEKKERSAPSAPDKKEPIVGEIETIHPYTKSIQGRTLDELQYIYGEQRHEFDTNLANLSKSEQDDIKIRIKLTQKQIEFRTNEMKKSKKDVIKEIDDKKAVDIDGNKIDYEHQINDVVITKSDSVGTIKSINGKFISLMDVQGNQISTTLENIKLVKRAPKEKSNEWGERFNQEQREIAEITKGNIELIVKKSLTDRFKRGVKEGDLTQKRYNEMVKDGTILNDVQYKKVVEINKKVQAIKDKPFFEPDVIQKSKIKNAAEALKWEAAHPPKEMQPPKEFTDAETKNFLWGVSEKEAVDKIVAKERSDLVRWVSNQNKDEVRFKGLEKKWTSLNRKEQKLPENQELRYQYFSLKKDAAKYSDSAKYWQRKINAIDSGEYQKINKNGLHNKYVDQVKKAIKTGKPVPHNVIKQYPEFTKAQNSRERYNKGRHTSFANVSIAVDESKKEMHGIKIKLQNGKPMTDKKADQIVGALSQLQNVVGDITHIMRKENLTISHTSGKHPFLSTYAGVYHPTDKTVTMGMQGVAAHEMAHFIDGAAKEHEGETKYDYNLLAKAKLEWNGGAKQALSQSRRKSKEELKEARELKVHLGGYWSRPEEIFARLVEQYTAYKNQDLSEDESYYSNRPYSWYAKTPAYWSKSEFEKLVPELEIEINRKIKLAEMEA